MPKPTKGSAPCTVSTPPISSPPPPPPPPPAPAPGTSAGIVVAQARSSSSVLARPPTHCEAVAAGGSPSEDQRSNTHALFEHFIEFMNYRDSISTSRSVSSPAQTVVAAPVLTLAPAGPSEFANPPTTVPGPKLGFRSISGDPRPFRPEVNNPASTSLRCASSLRRGANEGRS